MAKVFRPEKPLTDGLPLTPHEINNTLRQVIGEYNGRLDRDNFNQSAIPAVKLAAEAATSYDYIGESSSITLESKGQPVGTMYPVPRTAVGTDKMEMLINTTDGGLIIEGSVTVQSLGIDAETPTVPDKPYNHPWSLVVTVDGRVVAESGMSAAYAYSSRHVKQYVPIGAGQHRVGMHIRVGSSGRYIYAAMVAVAPTAYQIGPRNLFIRQVKR